MNGAPHLRQLTAKFKTFVIEGERQAEQTLLCDELVKLEVLPFRHSYNKDIVIEN